MRRLACIPLPRTFGLLMILLNVLSVIVKAAAFASSRRLVFKVSLVPGGDV
jgi:hypothetical protein